MNAYNSDQSSGLVVHEPEAQFQLGLSLQSSVDRGKRVSSEQEPIAKKHYAPKSIQELFREEAAFYEAAFSTQMAQLQLLYLSSFSIDVEAFLADNRAIPQVLIEARPELDVIFGGPLVSLRVEAADFGWRTLFADVLWRGSVEKVLSLLDEFHDDWWCKHFRSAGGRLVFTYRLI